MVANVSKDDRRGWQQVCSDLNHRLANLPWFLVVKGIAIRARIVTMCHREGDERAQFHMGEREANVAGPRETRGLSDGSEH